jgi:hypothetical protein
MNETTPWWMAGSVVATTITMKGWDWFQQRRSLRAAEGGAAALIEGLTERVEQLQARVTALDERLAQEIKARIEAQEQAAMLRVRIRILEHALRQSGIVVPPDELSALA